MRSISILCTLFFSLSLAQLLGASINILSIPIAVTLLPPDSTDTAQTPQTPTTDPQQTTPQQTSDPNVVVSNQVQTTISDFSTVVVTSAMSYAVLPSITSGATTLTFNSNTYTVSIISGKTSIYGGKSANGTSAGVSASVMGDKTVIVDSPQTTTVFGTSVLTTTASGATGVATDAGNGNKIHKAGELGVGVGVGIGVGLMALVIIVGLIIGFCLRKRRRQQQVVYKNEDMSASSTRAAAFDDDYSSTKSRSESGGMEKSELDGTSVHIVQQDPVELMGDLPRLLEMDGSQTTSNRPEPTQQRQSSRRRNRNNLELQTWAEEETQLEDEPPSPMVESRSRRATQTSMVSPISRSNSERDRMWPLPTAEDSGDRVV
jgi:hypothetical protein